MEISFFGTDRGLTFLMDLPLRIIIILTVLKWSVAALDDEHLDGTNWPGGKLTLLMEYI